MKYESSILNGLKVMSKVNAFVHASNADADPDARAMTLVPRTFVAVRIAKINIRLILWELRDRFEIPLVLTLFFCYRLIFVQHT